MAYRTCREVEPSQGHPESNLVEKLIYQDSLRVQPYCEGILQIGSGMEICKAETWPNRNAGLPFNRGSRDVKEAIGHRRAIRAVGAGHKYLDPTVTENLVGGYSNGPSKQGSEPKMELTDRESEVLKLIAWGYSNKEIAARLGLSVKTVEVHKANAMSKLQMRSRIDIVRFALLQGWLKEA
jgi:DNA-binding CsgD family transcriptional regulator